MGEDGADLIPEGVIQSVDSTLKNIEEIIPCFLDLIALSSPDVLNQLPPLHRAESVLLFAKITTVLVALRLRCSGVSPDDHLVKSELERLTLYEDKLERCIALSKEPHKPSITLNYQAATRFIQHSLPCLTPGQKQSLQNISNEKGPRIKYVDRNVKKKKRKHQSVQSSVNEFLEKASKELLGDNTNSSCFRGPLQPDDSDCSDS